MINDDFDIDEFNFDEEFSKDDVIQSFDEIPEKQEVDTIIMKSNKVIEVEDLMNYNEELHKEKHFKFEFHDDYDKDEDERIKEAFRDFLNLPKITGLNKGFSEQNKIPYNYVKTTHKHVEIKDIPTADDNDDPHLRHYSTIILHKNDEEELTSIDVVCSCGNLTKIQFQFDGTANDYIVSSSNVIIKDSSKDPSLASTDVTAKMMESPENFIDDENYHDSLMDRFDEIANVFPELDMDEGK